jgi:hypothetical protein
VTSSLPAYSNSGMTRPGGNSPPDPAAPGDVRVVLRALTAVHPLVFMPEAGSSSGAM